MFRLTLFRHAKSAQGNGSVPDLQRVLNDRGSRDAPVMGRVCAEKLPPPNIILASPAQRVRETLELFLNQWPRIVLEVVFEDRFYLITQENLRMAILEHSTDCDHLFFCGHQPVLGELASWLCAECKADMPTASLTSLVFSDGKMEKGTGKLDFFSCPHDFA